MPSAHTPEHFITMNTSTPIASLPRTAAMGKPELWRPVKRLLRHSLPCETRAWLLDPASLTRRVVAVCAGKFRVEVVFQGWRRPLLHEARVLGMRAGCHALIRQVYLLCNNQVWVYARTVIPRTTLTGRERRLAHLRTRPLGKVLFADPSMRRAAVEVTCLTARAPLFYMATRRLRPPPAVIWGRRSVFTLNAKPLLVYEIFLPAIPACRR